MYPSIGSALEWMETWTDSNAGFTQDNDEEFIQLQYSNSDANEIHSERDVSSPETFSEQISNDSGSEFIDSRSESSIDSWQEGIPFIQYDYFLCSLSTTNYTFLNAHFTYKDMIFGDDFERNTKEPFRGVSKQTGNWLLPSDITPQNSNNAHIISTENMERNKEGHSFTERTAWFESLLHNRNNNQNIASLVLGPRNQYLSVTKDALQYDSVEDIQLVTNVDSVLWTGKSCLILPSLILIII